MDTGAAIGAGLGVAASICTLAALVDVWRFPEAAFPSPRVRTGVTIALFVAPMASALVWFGWHRRVLLREMRAERGV